MEWNSVQLMDATEPAMPIVWLAAIVGLNKLFDVHSDSGAAMVALGLVVALFSGVVLMGHRMKKYGVGPWLNPYMLHWGLFFAVAGLVLMRTPEPWKFWGTGLLFLGVLYGVLGAIAYARKARVRAR